jgi:hypothetical protein
MAVGAFEEELFGQHFLRVAHARDGIGLEAMILRGGRMGHEHRRHHTPLRKPPQISPIFIQRQGHAPRFAGKGREIALGRCRMGRYEGRSAGRLRASSQGWKGETYPPQQGER